MRAMRTNRFLAGCMIATGVPLLLGYAFAAAAGQRGREAADRRLMTSIFDGDARGVRSALVSDADPNTRTDPEASPRTFAAILSDLLVWPRKVSPSSETALRKAVRVGNPEVVRLLLRAGANVDEVDRDGRTLLRLARFMRDWAKPMCGYATQMQKQRGTDHSAVVTLLEEAGAR
jgi:hypothetical protein